MEIEYSGIDESLVKWRYSTEPWHTAYIYDLIAKWESDKEKEDTFVKHMSTVTVRPVVYGRWIDTGSGQECSICKEIQYGYDSARNYCANCGAKMDESEEKDG